MKYLQTGGVIYGLFYLAWRGTTAALAMLTSSIHCWALKHCGHHTVFGYGVYVSHPKNIQCGADCFFGAHSSLVSESPLGQLRVGNGVQVSSGTVIDFTGNVEIGDRVLISPGVRILSHDHGYDPRSDPVRISISISEDVWIGDCAIILSSVERIEKGAIIGAGAVVTKPVQAWTIVAGNPARVIKTRAPQEVIEVAKSGAEANE